MEEIVVGLSGEDLSFEELVALVETYDPQAYILKVRERVVIVRGNIDYQKIYRRAALIKVAGEKVGLIKGKNIEWYKDLPSKSTFSVRGFLLNEKDLESFVGKEILKMNPNLSVNLDSPEFIFWLLPINSESFYLALSKNMGKKKWIDRRPRARPFFHPSALYPKLARFLVNLARIKEKEVLLDPFCGTGSILIEAELMDIYSLGIDINLRMCKGSLKNLKYFNLKGDVIHADSLKAPLLEVQAITTDLPYGRSSSTYGKDTSSIFFNLLKEYYDILKKGRYVVIMHNLNFEALEEGFDLIQRIKIPVHKSLIRVISVLRKK